MNGLTKNDSNIIGFVCTCFLSGAIDLSELQQWAKNILGENDEYPDYILELIDYNEARFHIYKTIGFVPSSKLSKTIKLTIDQIAYQRKGIIPDSALKSQITDTKWVDVDTVKQFNKIFNNVIFRLALDGD